MNKLILDLCGGTGSWSHPYSENGYDVEVVTLPGRDVKQFHVAELNRPVHGILAAPPCTMFSFARTNSKTPRDLKEGMECVRACLNIIWECMEISQPTKNKTVPLAWWALENPYYSLLPKFLGKPAFTFDPCEFGDGYKKRTALWGNFRNPTACQMNFEGAGEIVRKSAANSRKLPKFDRLRSHEIHGEYFGKLDRQTRRSITPAGFAKAFFEANP